MRRGWYDGCSSDDDDSSSGGSSDSSACEGGGGSACCAGPISACSQANKFKPCLRLVKKFAKHSSTNAPTLTASQKKNSDTFQSFFDRIVVIVGEDSHLTAKDIKAICRKQICVTVAMQNNANEIVRHKLRKKSDLDELMKKDQQGMMLCVHCIILNDRTYCAYQHVKRMDKKKMDNFGDM